MEKKQLEVLDFVIEALRGHEHALDALAERLERLEARIIHATLTFRRRVALKLHGRVYIRHEQRPGWRRPLPIYLAVCPRHGPFLDYPHGYNERLDCPICLEERMNTLQGRGYRV